MIAIANYNWIRCTEQRHKSTHSQLDANYESTELVNLYQTRLDRDHFSLSFQLPISQMPMASYLLMHFLHLLISCFKFIGPILTSCSMFAHHRANLVDQVTFLSQTQHSMNAILLVTSLYFPFIPSESCPSSSDDDDDINRTNPAVYLMSIMAHPIDANVYDTGLSLTSKLLVVINGMHFISTFLYYIFVVLNFS